MRCAQHCNVNGVPFRGEEMKVEGGRYRGSIPLSIALLLPGLIVLSLPPSIWRWGRGILSLAFVLSGPCSLAVIFTAMPE